MKFKSEDEDKNSMELLVHIVGYEAEIVLGPAWILVLRVLRVADWEEMTHNILHIFVVKIVL